jgi:hypothetical protein
MYVIKVQLQCNNKYSEVLSEDLDTTSMLIESVVSQALLEFFEVVTVQEVVVNYLPIEHRDDLAPPSL